MQKFKKKVEEQDKDSLEQLRESFEEIKQDYQEKDYTEDYAPLEYEEQAQGDTRRIRLKVGEVSSCGCGGSTEIEVWRDVPMDSPLQDGDTVDEFTDEDEII